METMDTFSKESYQRIDGYKYEDLVRSVDDKEFVTSVSKQGSGVRSLACLASDILFSDAEIVLIEEPELGLNPLVKQEFLSFLLEESNERQIFIATQDPTFVNLLHTTSLKDIHIYVEGTSDAYIFQILLEKHLKEKWHENWFEIMNKVGIYHLNRDNWKHLLYTIPKTPYRCALVLDGDKRVLQKRWGQER